MTRCSTVCFLNVKQHILSQLLPNIFGNWIPRAFEWDNSSFYIETYDMTIFLLKQIWIYNQARQMIFSALGVFYKSPFAPRKVSRWYGWLYVDIIASNPWVLMNQITFKSCWQLFKLQTFCIAFSIRHLKYYLVLQSSSANICCA